MTVATADQGSQTALRVWAASDAAELLRRAAGQFKAETGLAIAITLGPAGAMQAGFIEGTRADLLILPAGHIAALEREGRTVPASAVTIGAAAVAIAVKAGAALPELCNRRALASALRSADGIYLPDPRLTATGRHLLGLLELLGLNRETQGKLRRYPDDAAAIQALAESHNGHLIGCALATAIQATPGVRIARLLPRELAPATLFVAAVAARSPLQHHARRLAAILTSQGSDRLRRDCGLEPA